MHAVIPGVALDDAVELNRKIDGENLDGTTASQDLEGRVKYDFGTATVGTVYIYIAHK